MYDFEMKYQDAQAEYMEILCEGFKWFIVDAAGHPWLQLVT